MALGKSPATGEEVETPLEANSSAEGDIVDTEPEAEAKAVSPGGHQVDESQQKAPPNSSNLAEALAAQDELLELEMERLEQLQRRRELDEARIQAQATKPEGALPASRIVLGATNPEANGQWSPSGQSSLPPDLKFKSRWNKSERTTPGAVTSNAQPHREREVQHSELRARRLAQEALQRVRELAQERRIRSGRVALTIRLDGGGDLRLNISPRGDGSHELTFLVADPRLRQELQRSLAEIRSAAAELPLDVSDVLVEGFVQHSAPSDETAENPREQRDTI